jgi:uncharacterized protein
MKALKLAIAALVLSLFQQQAAAADQSLIAIGVTPCPSTDPAQPSSDCARGSSETEKQQCVQEENLARRVQLQIDSGAVIAATPVEFACNDNSKPFFMAYYHDLDPPAAVITYGDEQAIIFPQVAASGARYGRTGIEFWENHGSATVNFHGIKLVCTPVP